MNVVSLDMIEAFLIDVDMDFPIPLSDKVILNEYAVKLYEKATLCCEIDNGTIVGMVAGYTENIINDMAYIALVGVKKEYRGNGIASKLIKQFIDISHNKKINRIHVYTDCSNKNAMLMYEKLGFKIFNCDNEPRPNDNHYILKLF